MAKKRIDLLLVEKKLARSRTHAQDLIENQKVFIHMGGKKSIVLKANLLTDENGQIGVIDNELIKYVSRAGLKMESAINHLAKKIEGLKILDIGTSTGGFADFFIQKKADLVVGIDVGHQQISPQLKQNIRLQLHEGVNARYLSRDYPALYTELSNIQFDLISMDVSFISVDLIFPELVRLMSSKTELLSLIKPQFEVGSQFLNKNGIVTNHEQFLVVENKIKQNLESLGLTVLEYFPSGIAGKDGNQEYFVYAKI